MSRWMSIAAIRRRGWIIAAVTVLTGAMAYAVAQALPKSYESQTVLLVTATSSGGSLGNAGQASTAAVTYASLIENDQTVIQRVADATGLSASKVADGLTATPFPNSAVLRVRFRGPDATTAIAGAQAAAKAVAGDAPASANIAPGSMSLVRLPDRATRTREGYRATSVLVVPIAAGSLGVSANDSNTLAATYADLLPEDHRVIRYTARKIGASEHEVRQDLTVVNDFGTSLLRVRFKGSDSSTALRGAHAIATAVTGRSPVTTQIVPRSISLVRPAQAPSGAGSTHLALPAGIALGLLLGIVMFLVAERGDARVDTVEELNEAVGLPTFPLDRNVDRLAATAAARSHARDPARVTFWPVTADGADVASAVAEYVARRVRPTRPESAGPDGNVASADLDDAAATLELAADGSNIVVVTRGSRTRDVLRAVSTLRAGGGEVAWALLTPAVVPIWLLPDDDLRPETVAPPEAVSG
jgi:capsular polysaccharide biosynthesis protein